MPYKLAICEVFHPALHGQDENSSPAIHNHFLVYSIIDLPDFYTLAYLWEEHHLKKYYLNTTGGTLENHPTIRNYRKVLKKYIRLEIIQADVLTGQEEVAYLKTFWLRIVQRRWKKIYKARKALIQKRISYDSLKELQLTGKWPQHLRNWPLFRLFPTTSCS